MGRGVKIPWVWGSIYTMGSGVVKFQNFTKNLNFQNISEFQIFFIKFQKKNLNENKNSKFSKKISIFQKF